MIENGHNTEKSPGDLNENYCHSNSSERPSANPHMKSSQVNEVNNNNNNNNNNSNNNNLNFTIQRNGNAQPSTCPEQISNTTLP